MAALVLGLSLLQFGILVRPPCFVFPCWHSGAASLDFCCGSLVWCGLLFLLFSGEDSFLAADIGCGHLDLVFLLLV
jgi:hypothetical protein